MRRFNVCGRHQERALNFVGVRRKARPRGDLNATQAVRHQVNGGAEIREHLFQSRQPIAPEGSDPIVLFNHLITKLLSPQALPM
jgi:hypothetical protein